MTSYLAFGIWHLAFEGRLSATSAKILENENWKMKIVLPEVARG